MEVNELMIGDWLCYEGDRNIQVKGIDFPPNENSAYISFGAEFYPCNDFSPIPLTPEILEKNGFVFLTDLWYLITKERKPIHIVFKDNNIITLSINATPVPICLKYVHQLQHALRLCGIEKEIVL